MTEKGGHARDFVPIRTMLCDRSLHCTQAPLRPRGGTDRLSAARIGFSASSSEVKGCLPPSLRLLGNFCDVSMYKQGLSKTNEVGHGGGGARERGRELSRPGSPPRVRPSETRSRDIKRPHMIAYSRLAVRTFASRGQLRTACLRICKRP